MAILPTLGNGFGTISGIHAWFPVIFGVVVVIVLAGIAYTTYALIRSRRAVRRSGHDPDTLQADLAVRAMQSGLLAPSQGGSTSGSIDERLAEIERLHQSGTISDEERAAARERILGGA